MYNKRTWLNKKSSSSTGSVVAFCGDTKYKDEIKESTFIEIADCFGKITLHQTDNDTRGDFIHKMKTLKKEINEFIKYLENN